MIGICTYVCDIYDMYTHMNVHMYVYYVYAHMGYTWICI